MKRREERHKEIKRPMERERAGRMERKRKERDGIQAVLIVCMAKLALKEKRKLRQFQPNLN